MARLANAVRVYRKAANLTQEELAAKVGCSVSHLSYIEREERGVSDDLKLALCEALGQPFHRLFFQDVEKAG